jgi:hypothetical protein
MIIHNGIGLRALASIFVCNKGARVRLLPLSAQQTVWWGSPMAIFSRRERAQALAYHARRWTQVIHAAIANELPVGEPLDEETAIAITEALAGVLATHVEVVLRTLGAPGWERGH